MVAWEVLVGYLHPVCQHTEVGEFCTCLTRSHFPVGRYQVVAVFPTLLLHTHMAWERVVGYRH